MKKLIIAGSSKLQDRINYWHGYFEGQGYEVIDYPAPVPFDDDHASEITDIYTSFYQNLDRADVFFLMNEDKNDIGGYIGPSAIAELTYVIINNLNHGKKTEIYLLQMPSSEQNCYEEISFWLGQGWISLYERPTGKKALKTPEVITPKLEVAEEVTPTLPETPAYPEVHPVIPAPHSFLPSPLKKTERLINLRTSKKRCLKSLTPAAREYLTLLSPEFPAWLLKYLAAPEMQRLKDVSMVTVDYNALYNFSAFNSVFQHSLGVALIIWNFTHDQKATLAGLFHDIASPAFKHAIDYLNNDSETQESTEEHTSEIIRNSRVICRQLKKDGILPGEVSDYHLYPIADNALPGLAADRLEYTLSNGYFLYDTWTFNEIKTFYNDITILKNEHDIDELGFRTESICQDFVKSSLPLFAEYSSDKARATLQFIADIIRSMQLRDYLSFDDLYTMNEREIIDWVLSCGNKTISEAFRNFQRATAVYNSTTIKKDRYCTGVKAKVRYIVPLVMSSDASVPASRITDLSTPTNRAVQKYLDAKSPKYTGFDFEFTPYTE